MKKTLLALAVASALAVMGISRRYTEDVAIGFRMNAGNPGDVNRTHPASIVAGINNSGTQVVRLYGDPVTYDTATNGYRGFVAGDTAVTKIAGVAVRPYPSSQTSGGMTSTFGVGVPPINQPLDVIVDGFVMVTLHNGGTIHKGDPVFVWIAASTGNHVQGGIENAASSTNTASIVNAIFNGPPDSLGNVEIQVWPQG